MIIIVLAIVTAVAVGLRMSTPTDNMWRSGGKHWVNNMQTYQKQIEQDPKKAAGPMNGLANAYLDQGKFDLAIETYTKSIELDPQFPSPYNGRALAYQNKGDHGKARADLQKALELNPNYAFAYVNLGRNYMGLGQYEESIKAYTKAIELNPAYPDSYFNRAVCYEILGDHEQAIQNYTKVIEIAPNETNTIKAYETRSAINKYLGNDKEAVADLDRANLLKLRRKIVR